MIYLLINILVAGKKSIYIGVGIGAAILLVIGARVVYHLLCRKKETQPQPTQNTPSAAPIDPVPAPVESAPAVTEPQQNTYDGALKKYWPGIFGRLYTTIIVKILFSVHICQFKIFDQ